MRRRKSFPDLEAREAEIRRKYRPTSTCSNCGSEVREGEGHFVPPSLGDGGFFICAPSMGIRMTGQQQAILHRALRRSVSVVNA